MPIVALAAHEQAKDRLREAVKNDRLPQAILIEGPEGVGRQQVALWLAQLLFCTEHAKGSAPCGKCRGCRLVADLSHPDVHWFVPVPRPKAGDLDKQIDEVAQAIGDNPATPHTDCLTRIFVASTSPSTILKSIVVTEMTQATTLTVDCGESVFAWKSAGVALAEARGETDPGCWPYSYTHPVRVAEAQERQTSGSRVGGTP